LDDTEKTTKMLATELGVELTEEISKELDKLYNPTP
jgi:hypothetical protein